MPCAVCLLTSSQSPACHAVLCFCQITSQITYDYLSTSPSSTAAPSLPTKRPGRAVPAVPAPLARVPRSFKSRQLGRLRALQPVQLPTHISHSRIHSQPSSLLDQSPYRAVRRSLNSKRERSRASKQTHLRPSRHQSPAPFRAHARARHTISAPILLDAPTTSISTHC